MKTTIIVLKVPDIEQVPICMWCLALCIFLPIWLHLILLFICCYSFLNFRVVL